MSAIDVRPFPRWALQAAAALIGVAILGAAYGRFERAEEPPGAPRLALHAAGAPLAARTLAFIDQGDGVIEVRDPTTGAVVRRLTPETDGFVFGAMRGLRQARTAKGAARDPVLLIERWPDGRVTLFDPATAVFVNLRAFGIDNKAAFEAFLPPAGVGGQG
jgi:putative photosynthetic complex assembly protein